MENNKKRNNPSPEELMKQAKLETLDKQLAEKSELVSEVTTWLENKKAKEAELLELESRIKDCGDAISIIEKRDEIISTAQAKAAELENDSLELKASIEKDTTQLQQLKELLGNYLSGAEILDAANKKAADITDDASSKAEALLKEYNGLISGAQEEARGILEKANDDAKQTRSDAETDAQNKIDEANTLLQDAKDDAIAAVQKARIEAEEIVHEAKEEKARIIHENEDLVQNAKQSAETILKEARDLIEAYHANKDAEGEARKSEIIESANVERQRIIAQAHADGETLNANCRAAAEDYASKQRANADFEAKHIIEQAYKHAEEIEKQASATHNEALSHASEIRRNAEIEALKIKESASSDISSTQARLDAALLEAAHKEEELSDKIKKADRQLEIIEQRKGNLQAEIDERVEAECEITRERFRTLSDVANSLRRENKELNDLKKAKLQLQSDLKDVAELESLKSEIEEYRNRGITLDTLEEFATASEQLKKAETQIKTLKTKNSTLSASLRDASDNTEELEALKDKNKYYADVIQELTDELSKSKKVDRADMIAPIKMAPSFLLKTSLKDDSSIGSEKEWLDYISDKITNESKLTFKKRQLYAYHTAQKIRDMSPLVVLAGVSGTGKSELPKNYAIHGGMNFLSIPVKPDWDSPASLFGYYNSIERRFEATELVRALYQMSKDSMHSQQMMMVLLDEMNLAHPEQYFADLLSKLETCRGMNENAQYDIILGGGEDPERLDVGPNILWTGTMNEDETTKGLSDKVIDRSTLITFPRPKELFGRDKAGDISSKFILTRKKWDEWCRIENQNPMIAESLDRYKNVIQSINEQMSGMGRNLGHRVWQGIAKYVCHHPNVIYAKTDDALMFALERAFSDAIAFKVMPKLRGVEVRGSNEEKLESISRILAENASELLPDFNNATQLTTELFQWCSADFMTKDDE